MAATTDEAEAVSLSRGGTWGWVIIVLDMELDLSLAYFLFSDYDDLRRPNTRSDSHGKSDDIGLSSVSEAGMSLITISLELVLFYVDFAQPKINAQQSLAEQSLFACIFFR